ncbi:hypothetical protein [Peribacillus kribbensis]|uniref:hypothetical protein n=1 Tax=Peribacillus kribbensis TaxID=356658 RepID=UPI00040601BB|nr:hypothetical protein [Peribacillus kribbensis]
MDNRLDLGEEIVEPSLLLYEYGVSTFSQSLEAEWIELLNEVKGRGITKEFFESWLQYKVLLKFHRVEINKKGLY